MKKEQLYVIIICLLSLFVSVGCGPSAEKILGRAYDKCQSIENGYYEATKQIKQIASIDTIVVEQTGHFKKIEDDNIYTFAFHSHFRMPSLSANMSLLYNGNEMVEYSTNNAPKITPKKDRVLEIRNSFVKNPALSSYWPITNKNSYPLPSRELLSNGTTTVKLIGEESINGHKCYRIRVKFDPSYDNTTVKSLVSKLEYDFWIDKKEYLTIQFAVYRDLTLDGKVVNVYEKQTLNKYDFNSIEDETIFTLESLPSLDAMVEAPSLEKEELLAIGSIAPNWEMSSTTGKKYSLHDFRGSFVLLEFTTIACPACIQIIPDLTFLHEKYKDKGVQIIAVYSYVRTNADILNYIKKHNIDYTALIDSSDDVSRQYNIFCFPTTYLIDREGKIVFQCDRLFGEEELDNIERILEQNL